MLTSQRGRARASISHLPTEILGEVFNQYVSLDNSPWCLTFICRGWQRVALSTPALWTHIIVTNHIRESDQGWIYSGREKYSAGRASICLKVPDFREAVNRAGILLLHIDVKVDCSYGLATADIIEDLLEEAFSSPIARRTFNLIININYRDDEHLGWKLGLRAFPRLELLRVDWIPEDWMPDLLKSAYTSPALSFRSLEISSRYHLTEGQVRDFAHRWPNLERLGGILRLWPNGQTQVNLPCIKELILDCNSAHISRLCLPQLQSLEISLLPSLDPATGAEIGQLEFPLLLKLRVTARDTRWLENLVTPRLQSLSIVGVYHYQPTDWKFRPMSCIFPTVKTLSFESSARGHMGDGDTRDALLIAAFQAVPNATSVSMFTGSSSSFDPKLRLQLLDRLGSMDADDILCPHLRELELTSRTRRSSELADYEIYLLKRIVDARKPMGGGLKRFVIAWKEPGLEQLLTQRFA